MPFSPRLRPFRFLSTLVAALAPLSALAQGGGSLLGGDGLLGSGGKFRLKAEVKANVRSSTHVVFAFRPVGVPEPIALETPSAHSSAEISNVALVAEADFTPHLSAKAEVHVLDLYNRNPSSSDQRIFVREAWLRAGKKFDVLRPIGGTTVYLQVGKAPRFSKQLNRRFEGYGLWGTAVGRFEEVGVEAGGTFGTVVYWRASAVNGNPLFMRDPNALAGDNGTPERTGFPPGEVVYKSGFPILYDAKATDVNFSGRWQVGGGLGLRFNWGENGRDGVDLLGWYFRRDLQPRAAIDGSFYGGDLDLLKGFPGGVPLPTSGTEKREWGANLEVKWGGLQLYGQYVDQEIASLKRHGFEAEAAFRIALNGLFVSGDAPVLNWVQPVVRYSKIDNDFARAGFVAPSLTWDWTKWDVGARLGIVRGLDLTGEYSFHEALTSRGPIHPDEFLLTLRAAF